MAKKKKKQKQSDSPSEWMDEPFTFKITNAIRSGFAAAELSHGYTRLRSAKPLPSLQDRPPAQPMPGYVAVVRVDRPDDNGYDCGVIVATAPEFYWVPDHGLAEGMTIFYARGMMGASPADIDGYLYVPMQLVIASEPAPAP